MVAVDLALGPAVGACSAFEGSRHDPFLPIVVEVENSGCCVVEGPHRDPALPIAVVVRDACYSARGSNHDFFMDRVFPRMARVRSVDETVKLMRPEI